MTKETYSAAHSNEAECPGCGLKWDAWEEFINEAEGASIEDVFDIWCPECDVKISVNPFMSISRTLTIEEPG